MTLPRTLRTPRLPLLAAASVALALGLPAAAQARAVVLGATHRVHGYDLAVVAETGQPDVTVLLSRKRGRSAQEHVYTFGHVAVGARRISGRLGRLGRVDLRFHERGHHALPPGCHGRVRHGGVWKGRLELKVDGDFFGVIARHRLPGAILARRGAECDEPGMHDAVQGTLLQVSTKRIAVMADGDTTSVLVQQRRRGARIEHLVTAPSRLSVADDLSAATVTPRRQRLLTGGLTFSGAIAPADGPRGETAPGTVTGDLTAHFDSIGDVSLPRHAAALLERVDAGRG